jgi:hypothetical protein
MLSQNPFTSRRKVAPPDGQHYRELASKLIELAALCRFVGARSELSKLAASFARRADLLDGRCR